MICVVIGRARPQMVEAEIEQAGAQGAQLIELRLDFLARAPDLKKLLERKPCPMIATVRRPVDGGRWSGSEEARLALLRQAIISGFDWVDLETDVIDGVRRLGNVRRIVSYHNLREVPDDLESIYERMCRQDADVVKIAVTAQQPEDNLRVLELLRQAPKPTVAFCMGDLGTPSRILQAKYGAPFTYAVFNKERGVAPGILSWHELKRVYRYDQINAQTDVYGVIGDPIAHSLSPQIHNAALRHLGLNAVYLPFRVPRGRLETFLAAFQRIPVRGYSVTIPHKEHAAAVAAVKDPAVVKIGAANTLVLTDQGFAAYNTDYRAAIDSLLHHLPRSPDAGSAHLEGRLVLLLGAGGVARALAHALRDHGAIVTIANRTPERALDLAAETRSHVVGWEVRHTVACDILVNGTSIGMHPNVDDSPVHPSFLKSGLHVFDTVYTPENTLLVKEARARGCIVLTGVDMFIRQAAIQFELFTGRPAPLDLMTKVVRRALSPVTLPDEDT